MDWQIILYLLAWAALFAVVMRFGCGAHMMGDHRGDTRFSGAGYGAGWTPPAKAAYPVCGRTIDTAGAKSTIHAGRVYFFCSQDCRDKFERNPGTYEKVSETPSHQAEAHHGCC
jgi:YHS domain-containing protein